MKSRSSTFLVVKCRKFSWLRWGSCNKGDLVSHSPWIIIWLTRMQFSTVSSRGVFATEKWINNHTSCKETIKMQWLQHPGLHIKRSGLAPCILFFNLGQDTLLSLPLSKNFQWPYQFVTSYGRMDKSYMDLIKLHPLVSTYLFLLWPCQPAVTHNSPFLEWGMDSFEVLSQDLKCHHDNKVFFSLNNR